MNNMSLYLKFIIIGCIACSSIVALLSFAHGFIGCGILNLCAAAFNLYNYRRTFKALSTSK